ncbi:MAG: LacI family transcriptional regulator [Bifidobacteriaceae bacterium]|jgi:LacI family transcriptional regulator|nr:LacI family transcriptional regulator [Bifidobacteriaceae bacterium]
MAGRVTIADVAARAGVSSATVSRVIAGASGRRVRDDLSERVRKAAEELRYAPNMAARAMARGQAASIGLIVADIADSYFSSITAGVIARADEADVNVILTTTQNRSELEARFVRVLGGHQVEAIILAGGRRSREVEDTSLAVRDYRADGGAVVLIGQQGLNADTVEVGNSDGAASLAQALWELGYRRFSILGGEPDHRTVQSRRDGFVRRLAELGVSVPGKFVIDTDSSYEGGEAGMVHLASLGDLPDVVFAVNDVVALGVLAAARAIGVDIPGRMGLAGFDDIPTLRALAPSITTVRLPLVQIGRQAAALALTAAVGAPPRVVSARGEVICRDSTPRR